jgi:hypothetical protein
VHPGAGGVDMKINIPELLSTSQASVDGDNPTVFLQGAWWNNFEQLLDWTVLDWPGQGQCYAGDVSRSTSVFGPGS